MIYGIDVSHHQEPSATPWRAPGLGFGIIRTSYGSELTDRKCLAHAAVARDAGVPIGAYHFFRPSQPWTDQSDLFLRRLSKLDMRPGDIIPWLDIEDDPLPQNQLVTPMWSEACEQICIDVSREYGQCGVYITQRGWKMLDSPDWVLERPLWVAHYTSRPEPATPGNGVASWTIWQHRVGPFVLDGAGGYDKDHPVLDQNRAKFLPLIQAKPTAAVEQTDDSELERLLNYADFLQFEDAQNLPHSEPEDFLEDTKPDGRA